MMLMVDLGGLHLKDLDCHPTSTGPGADPDGTPCAPNSPYKYVDADFVRLLVVKRRRSEKHEVRLHLPRRRRHRRRRLR